MDLMTQTEEPKKIPGRWRFQNRPEGYFVAGRNSECGIKAGEKVMIVSYTCMGQCEDLCNVVLRNHSGSRLFDLPDTDATWRFVMADA